MPRAMPRPIDRYGESAMASRACDHPGCASEGMHKAPRSREALTHYYWFCLDHVRSYNAAWNYYAGMSEPEIEAEIRRDTVWQRPSWKLGQRHGPAYETRMRDHFGVYGENAGKAGQQRRAHSSGPDASARVASAREQALAVFDMDPPFTQSTLKARYKVLVKMHHPDAHGGDKEAEEKLKIINQAYTTLKASYFA